MIRPVDLMNEFWDVFPEYILFMNLSFEFETRKMHFF